MELFKRILSPIINLTNSAIGVALMTIPYSFSECGIVLTFLTIILIAIITVLACEFLLKSASKQCKPSYEDLCMATFGWLGKAALELNMIGMMYGSLVAYVIILGDLGSELMHEQFHFKIGMSLRVGVVILSMVVILPLCLRKNIDSLANASAISLIFYAILSLHLIFMSPHSTAVPSKSINETELTKWRSYGLFTVVPIISLGFTLQTQVFAVFNSMSQSNTKDMQIVIRVSATLVALLYCLVGFFGYLHFGDFRPKISADLLSMYPPSLGATLMKVGFLVSVAISYPLTAFPVRSSLYSLLFVKNKPHTAATVTSTPDFVDSFAIPDELFNRLTFGIIFSSCVFGLIMANIEVVLSLAGSLSGSIVLFILPAVIRIKSTRHHGNGDTASDWSRSWSANLMLLFGLAIFALSFLNSVNTQVL